MKPQLLDNTKPTPGSDDAVKLGCKCPRMDNCYGRGYMGIPDLFVFTVGCPVHATKIAEIEEAQ